MTLSITQLFAPTQLSTVATPIYVVPTTNPNTVLKGGAVRFTNVSTGSRKITAYACQAGTTPQPGNIFLNQETLNANAHVDILLPVLAAGGQLEAFTDQAMSVNIFQLDGVLFTPA